jgi:hypothetical protein
VQRLYRARPQRVSGRAGLPERLPGLSRLTRLERAEIDYGRARSCLTAVASELSWAPNRVPDITMIKTQLDGYRHPPAAGDPAAGDPAAGESADEQLAQYHEAVLDAHLSLIIALTGAGSALGKAYSLGRALADTCRPSQEPADLQDSFDPNRLAQLRHDLDDLASVLPEHAAKAVGQSLTWWRDAVFMADDSPTGRRRRQVLSGVRTDAPALRTRPGIPNPKISMDTLVGDMITLREALPRQGERWRVVLTGEQRPQDLLAPGDYLNAAMRAVSAGRRLAGRTLMAAPALTFSLLAAASAILAVVLVVISNSHASGGGKLAAVLVTVGGYLTSLVRAAVPRVKAAVSAVEQPLFQSALDYVSAEAISVPPVGHPDPSGWSRLAQAAPAVPAAPATQAEPPAPPAQAPAEAAAGS